MYNPQRYYSQQYSSVDDDPSADISSTNIGLDQYSAYEPRRNEEQYVGYEPSRNQEQYTQYAPNHNPAQQAPQRTAAATYEDLNLPPRTKRTWWTRRRKFIVFGGIGAFVVLLIIIIAVAVSVSGSSFHYTPSYASVTNETAFETGGATRNNPEDSLQDGIGRGMDVYRMYSGDASAFPASSEWISFEDMWKINLPGIRTSCSALGEGKDNS